MPRYFDVASRGVGLPDYSAAKPTGAVPVGPTYTLTDVGENAARLGSIDTYDRRGSIVFLDDFEGPVLRWRSDYGPVGSYARLDSDSARSGVQAVKLHSVDEAGPISGHAGIQRRESANRSRQLGLEFSFNTLSIDCDLIVYMNLTEATSGGLRKETFAKLKIDPNARKIYVTSDDITYIEVADTGILSLRPFEFNTVKLVVDFENEAFMRLLFNHDEHDISHIACPATLAGAWVPATRYVEIQIDMINRGITGGECWCDDVILTQNEPANT